MITDGIINAIYFIVHLIATPILLLPDVMLPQGFYDAMSNVISYIKPFNTFLPIDTFLVILGISAGIELAYLTYKLIMWIVRRFPTQS